MSSGNSKMNCSPHDAYYSLVIISNVVKFHENLLSTFEERLLIMHMSQMWACVSVWVWEGAKEKEGGGRRVTLWWKKNICCAIYLVNNICLPIKCNLRFVAFEIIAYTWQLEGRAIHLTNIRTIQIYPLREFNALFQAARHFFSLFSVLSFSLQFVGLSIMISLLPHIHLFILSMGSTSYMSIFIPLHVLLPKHFFYSL